MAIITERMKIHYKPTGKIAEKAVYISDNKYNTAL